MTAIAWIFFGAFIVSLLVLAVLCGSALSLSAENEVLRRRWLAALRELDGQVTR